MTKCCGCAERAMEDAWEGECLNLPSELATLVLSHCPFEQWARLQRTTRCNGMLCALIRGLREVHVRVPGGAAGWRMPVLPPKHLLLRGLRSIVLVDGWGDTPERRSMPLGVVGLLDWLTRCVSSGKNTRATLRLNLASLSLYDDGYVGHTSDKKLLSAALQHYGCVVCLAYQRTGRDAVLPEGGAVCEVEAAWCDAPAAMCELGPLVRKLTVAGGWDRAVAKMRAKGTFDAVEELHVKMNRDVRNVTVSVREVMEVFPRLRVLRVDGECLVDRVVIEEGIPRLPDEIHAYGTGTIPAEARPKMRMMVCDAAWVPAGPLRQCSCYDSRGPLAAWMLQADEVHGMKMSQLRGCTAKSVQPRFTSTEGVVFTHVDELVVDVDHGDGISNAFEDFFEKVCIKASDFVKSVARAAIANRAGRLGRVRITGWMEQPVCAQKAYMLFLLLRARNVRVVLDNSMEVDECLHSCSDEEGLWGSMWALTRILVGDGEVFNCFEDERECFKTLAGFGKPYMEGKLEHELGGCVDMVEMVHRIMLLTGTEPATHPGAFPMPPYEYDDDRLCSVAHRMETFAREHDVDLAPSSQSTPAWRITRAFMAR